MSESAVLEPDGVMERIKQRAMRIWGWKNNSTQVEPLKTQRYGVGGFYTFHYDWAKTSAQGNRVATFMVYLVGNCTGGGTNFPYLKRPPANGSSNSRWCSVIDCEDDDYDGVTFKPVAGSAVYWENLHANGSFHKAVYHAALPVESGEKIGLNVWLWDDDWHRPPGEEQRLLMWKDL